MIALLRQLPNPAGALLIPARAALAASAALLASCEESGVAGHEKMVALLAKEADRRSLLDNRVGQFQAPALRHQLARLAGAEPRLRWPVLRGLASEESRLGNIDAAISLYSEALGLIRAQGIENKALYLNILELAIVYLRLGETQNCVGMHTSDSCILPIRGKGVYQNQESSRKAIALLEEYLGRFPGAHGARWLLNIACMTIGEYPDGVPGQFLIPPETFASDEPFPRFTDIAPQLGLNAFDLAGGSAVDDFNGDGWLDIVCSTSDPAGQMRYFEGNPDKTFTERTQEAGLVGLFGGLNLNHTDYNNDGFPDILVLRGAWLGRAGATPNSLLRNNGDGTFTDVTFDAGLAAANYPTQTASWADYDNDGDLDLYVGNETDPEFSAPCQLFRNEGDGTFVDVAREAGVLNQRYTKGVIWGDYDGDRYPDLYVSNMFGVNRLYHNNGDGTFTDVAGKLNVLARQNSFMPWFWDFDNDGALDLWVATYAESLDFLAASYLGLEHGGELACLYRGDGKGGFREVAAEQGLTLLTLTMGCNFGDLDNDGYLDFYQGTGYPGYEALMPNVMYRNRGGTGFEDVTMAGGFGHLQKGHGVAFADIDYDGDQDVYMQLGGAYPGDTYGNALFENPGFDNHWIRVRLRGVESNRPGIGARIRCEIREGGERRSVYRHVNSGGSFGGNPFMQMIGLGKAAQVEVLEVYWPTSDRLQTFRDVAVNQSILITEGRDSVERLPR